MKNVIFITVDCLREDFLRMSDEFEFSNLRRLTDKGMIFSNMIAAGSNTMNSFPALFSSSYSSMYGGYSYLSKHRITLAEILKERGFTTAGIHSNAFLIATHGYDKGFDFYYDYTKTKNNKVLRYLRNAHQAYKEKARKNKYIEKIIDKLSDSGLLRSIVYKGFSSKKPYDNAEIINKKAFNWLNQKANNKQSFFLWLHYMDSHAPYEIYDSIKDICKKKNLNQSKAADLYLKAQQNPDAITKKESEDVKYLYLSQLKYLDEQIEQLLDFLEKSDYMQDTVIIIASDHGEEFFEHNLFAHASNLLFKKREMYLYNTVLKIPLIIYGKDIKAERIGKLASSIDIAPTICSLLDTKRPAQWLGQDILSKDFDRSLAVSEQVYFENGNINGGYCFQNRKEKFIYNTYDNSYKYFRLDEDPEEQNNLIDKNPEKKNKIKKLYNEHIKLVSKTEEKLPEKELDFETERRLKELGYM
jgi:arylsulfatase A-like enzyme